MVDSSLKAVLAACVSFFFASLLFGLMVLLWRRRRSKRKQRSRGLNLPTSTSDITPVPEGSASFDPSLDGISMAKLAVATGNFSPDFIIGDGAFGFVYKAQLADGTTVAIKKLSPDAFDGFREFRAEVETLGRVRHRNLARILGYCVSGMDRLLIYEFLERGSLDQWLHETSLPPPPPGEALRWGTRVEVIRGVAAGLAFLHNECKPRIIHRDIKASNVLLDAAFQARIADFGLARPVESSRSHVSTQIAGTMGYMPPEYRDGFTVATTKADVYSFGALMFEVATGRRPSWPVVVEGKEVTLVWWARRRVEEGRGEEILDHLMGKEGLRQQEVKGFLAVAYRCTSDCSKNRPSMEEVVILLNKL